MFIDDKPEVESIEQREGVIDHATDDFTDILSALVNVLTFEMELAYPGCHKNIAKQLRKRIPEMLSDANRLAASAGPREHKHLH